MERGIAYGVGVGPGDPELMTLKAVRLIRENPVIAVPGKDPLQSVAYKIAVQAVPELAQKELLPIDMPMVRDHKQLRENHEKGAKKMEEVLNRGQNVIYLTLGDSTIYCTFTYLQTILQADGYESELVSGISSISAAAARLNIPLAEWHDAVHIIPSSHQLDHALDQKGTYVLMKAASKMKETKELLRQTGREVQMVENCGMPNERIYRSLEEIPDEASYYSLIIAKETGRRRFL